MVTSTPNPGFQFPGGGGSTGPISRGPGIGGVPSIGTPMTGPVSTNYNGGANGNRQMGMFWANESLKAQYVIVNDEDADKGAVITKSLHEGMFLFNASRVHDLHHKPLENTVQLYGNKVSVMYDVWGVNQILQRRALEYNTPEISADVIFQLWAPMGVIKTEAAPTRTRLGDERFGSRMVNLVVGYRVKTFNIWGGDIDVGTRMFFICKKVKADASAIAMQQQQNKRQRFAVEYVWKIFPYASKQHDTPPLSVLQYEEKDENDNIVMNIGSYVCVGMSSERVLTVPSTLNELDRSDLILKQFRESSTNSRYPPQVEIYVAN
jgi:hypothetical protein